MSETQVKAEAVAISTAAGLLGPLGQVLAPSLIKELPFFRKAAAEAAAAHRADVGLGPTASKSELKKAREARQKIADQLGITPEELPAYYEAKQWEDSCSRPLEKIPAQELCRRSTPSSKRTVYGPRANVTLPSGKIIKGAGPQTRTVIEEGPQQWDTWGPEGTCTDGQVVDRKEAYWPIDPAEWERRCQEKGFATASTVDVPTAPVRLAPMPRSSGRRAPEHELSDQRTSQPTGPPMAFDWGNLLSGLSPLLGTVSPVLGNVAKAASSFIPQRQVGPAPQSVPPPTWGLVQPISIAAENAVPLPPMPRPSRPGPGAIVEQVAQFGTAAGRQLAHIVGTDKPWSWNIMTGLMPANLKSRGSGARTGGARMNSTRHPFYATPGYDSTMQKSFCPPGYRLVSLPGGAVECVRRRRMNPCNIKALSKAGRRISSFVRIAKRYIRMTSPPGHRTRPHGFKYSRKCGRRKSCR